MDCEAVSALGKKEGRERRRKGGRELARTCPYQKQIF